MNSRLRHQAALLLVLVLSGCASQTAVPMKTIYIPVGTEAIYDKYQYAPVIRTGDTVILSGIPASGPGSYEDKVRRMFERVKETLALAGGDMSDIVEITTFHSGPKDTAAFDDEFARFLQIHAEYFPKGKYPAWTAIGNAVLLSPGAVVEMRVVAVVGSGAHFEVDHARAANEPFVGAWKLDPSKSQLADQLKVDNVGGNRYAFDFGGGTETVAADGTDQPGYGGTTLAVTLLGSDSLKVIRKQDGRVLLTANWQLSKDGSTLSDDFTSFAPDGRASNSKYVYKRTTVTQGFAGTWVSTNVAVNYTFVLKFQPYDGNGLSLISPYSDKPKNLSFDGKDYPNLSSNASPGSAYAAQRTSDRVMEITNKLNGKVVDTQQYMLSVDLKTLTLTIYKTGEHTPSVWVFERQ